MEKVRDWNKRLANFPPATMNIYKLAWAARDKFFEVLNEDSHQFGWSIAT